VASYEFVSVVHRRIMERAFGVPVFNLYGSTETGHLLMEADSGEMHPSYGTALLEVVDADAEGISDLVVTTLTNDYMPLIRYRIGDLVERRERPYRTSYRVHGRTKDAFNTASGRRVTTWQIDQCLADLPGIAHYQLGERAGGEWLLRYVSDRTAPSEVEIEELRRRVADLVGATGKLVVHQADLLSPESSGKFRLGYPLKRD